MDFDLGMTMAEKILTRASGREEVSAGEFVTAKPDIYMVQDEGIAEMAMIYSKTGVKKIPYPERVVSLLDHKVPPPTTHVASLHKMGRRFIKEFGIRNFYDWNGGICHQILPEKGHARPGMLIVGTDSHTTTYGAFNCASCGVGISEAAYLFATGELWFRVPETIKFEITGENPDMVMSKDVILYISGKYGTDVALYRSIEFTGPTAKNMSVASRMTMSNMTVDLGGKFGIFECDKKTIDWLEERTTEPFTPVKSDPDAIYEETYEVDVANLEPQVACPHDVSNVKPVTEVEGLKIDQAFLGSCTNGRFEDLEIAARIMKGKKLHPDTRMLVIPASWEIYRKALEAGLLTIFIDAGAIICNPTCGPCFGGHMGLIAEGERCLASINRNFKGRMGSTEAEVYLANPATVAASAVRGVITDPRKA